MRERGGRERDRQTERETETERDRQTDRQTDRERLPLKENDVFSYRIQRGTPIIGRALVEFHNRL